MTDTRARRRRGRGGSGDGAPVVPDVEFTSYYGRPVVKASPWANDIPAYLFLGGLAAGSSLLGAGADLTGRRALRRTGRLGALVSISL
ncbi:MAG: nitrite reductase, partial [Jatrophihabitans sp.]